MSNCIQKKMVGSFTGKVITWIVGIIVTGIVIRALWINVDLRFWAFMIAPTMIAFLLLWIVATRHRKKK